MIDVCNNTKVSNFRIRHSFSHLSPPRRRGSRRTNQLCLKELRFFLTLMFFLGSRLRGNDNTVVYIACFYTWANSISSHAAFTWLLTQAITLSVGISCASFSER